MQKFKKVREQEAKGMECSNFRFVVSSIHSSSPDNLIWDCNLSNTFSLLLKIKTIYIRAWSRGRDQKFVNLLLQDSLISFLLLCYETWCFWWKTGNCFALKLWSWFVNKKHLREKLSIFPKPNQSVPYQQQWLLCPLFERTLFWAMPRVPMTIRCARHIDRDYQGRTSCLWLLRASGSWNMSQQVRLEQVRGDVITIGEASSGMERVWEEWARSFVACVSQCQETYNLS